MTLQTDGITDLMAKSEIPREDVEAALHTRRELGPDYEPAIVDSLVERIDSAIEARVAAELERRRPARDDLSRKDHSDRALALGIVTVVLAVPLTAIAAGMIGFPAVVLTWISLVLINMAYAIGNRR
jgi:hypothetical protein